MDKKGKILIVTANDYLAYQPSILNLYDYLDPVFDTTIISFEPEFIGKQKPDGRRTVYLKIPGLLKELAKKTDYLIQLTGKMVSFLFSIRLKKPYYQRLQLHYLKRALKNMQADRYIAVDIPALCVTQSVVGKCHFFSLELSNYEVFKKSLRIGNILSVVIQNRERYAYLFGQAGLPVFFVQNAPVFAESMIRNYERRDLVWAGTILKRFAILDCIEFIRTYPAFRLIMKGGAERKTERMILEQDAALLASGNLVIDRSYASLDEFLDYLSHFRIGFCFYAWDLIASDFNYQTAPSGKLFMYLAAGVPVIACDIPGFQFVREFGAGILIGDYRPQTIFSAIREIESRYEDMQTACYKAARHFSFDRTIAPFVDFLSHENAGEKKGPTISICIPAYKRPDFMTRLLDSIAAQEYKDFEVVVTDDSPDQAIQALCGLYRDRFPLTYYRNPVPLGTPGNWNEAVKRANGSWIKIMHDDDWFASKDSLARFAAAALSAQAGDLIFSGYCNVYLPGDRQKPILLRASRYRALKRAPCTLFARNAIGPPSVTLYKKGTDRIFDTRMKWLVDVDFYIRCLAGGRPCYIPETLVNIGVGDQQVTLDAFRKRSVEIPESFLLFEKSGAYPLKNLHVYDAWWRLIRNLGIQRPEEIREAGYPGGIFPPLLSMISWQGRIPAFLLNWGPGSKILMFLNYLVNSPGSKGGS